MRGTIEVVKGRIEEAAGALTGNDRLRTKGQDDQVVGHVKQAGEKGIRQARKSARRIVAGAKELAQQAIAKAQSRH